MIKGIVPILRFAAGMISNEIMDNIEEKKIMSAIEKYLAEECK